MNHFFSFFAFFWDAKHVLNLHSPKVEAQLDELERFVGLIEKHRVIIIADDYGHGGTMRF